MIKPTKWPKSQAKTQISNDKVFEVFTVDMSKQGVLSYQVGAHQRLRIVKMG